MKQSQQNYKRVVIKIGSSLLYSDGARLDENMVRGIAAQIAALFAEGTEVIVVSSGAIALGMSALKMAARPRELSFLQAAAAVGQNELMDVYRRFLQEQGLGCGQVLLTWEDFNDRTRYLNAKNTLLALLSLHCVPVINENDTVSTDEIKFGDNDRLSAFVAMLTEADLLVILSDVQGLLDKDGNVVGLVEKITPQIRALACPTQKKKICVGGMITKIEAARMAGDSGIPCVIASGRRENVIREMVHSPGAGATLFLPKKESLAAKKSWIAFSAKPKGFVIIDDGAALALRNKKSLLSVGVIACEGEFSAGDVVGVRDKSSGEFARGRIRCSSRDIDKVKGRRSEKEIINRDDIVLLE